MRAGFELGCDISFARARFELSTSVSRHRLARVAITP